MSLGILRRLMLVVALGAALTAFGGMRVAFADDGDGGGDAPAAVADAPEPDTTLAEGQTGDEMLPDSPTADAMSAIRKGLVSLLSECRPDSTLVSIQTLLNPIDPAMSTLLVVTRGDSDRVLDEPISDLVASCTTSASDLVASVTQGETDLFALMR